MAQETWVVVGSKFCDMIKMQADLRELRVYPSDEMPDTLGAGYVVKARQCTAGVECNMAGVPCQMAFNNPGFDRFPE